MQNLDAIVFDLDGTLLDSAPDIRQGVNLMLKDYGRPELTLEQVKGFIGEGSMELCRKALLATGGLPSDDLMVFVRSFIQHYRNAPPSLDQIFPHVVETLDHMVKHRVKLGICTNKTEASTKQLLSALNLDKYFSFVAGGDTFTVHKPHPGHVLGVVEALDADIRRCVFVGDGPSDVSACAQAGIKCILVTHGYSQEYSKLKADKLIDSFEGLDKAIADLGFEVP